ncbi:MAG: glycosyl hydrolase-related protein [Lachnospiraceae bacterium]|nr:glycosyl hydrolase-related protein [Lachnospiraceae bacterium]
MKTMNSEWRDRVRHWIRTLREDLYEPLGEISWSTFCTMEHLPQEEALRGEFTPVSPGFTWGHTWEYCWLKSSFVLPDAAEGKRIVLNLNPDGESTIFVNGREFGTYRADWVAQPHHFMEDNTISFCGKPGETYDILMETYAGHYFPNTDSCGTGPVLPGAFQDPLKEGARRTLGVCTYGIWNEDAYQLYMDAATLYSLLEAQDETSLRAAKIAKALEQFTLVAEFEQEKERRIASYQEARKVLQPALEAVNGSTAPVFYAVGNSHLDLAWLWPMAETHRKTARTFAAQLRLMDEYPEYKYIQSQPASYEMCKKYYPELFARIKEAVKRGQWIAEGGMWVEPDTNLSGGEALIRQLLLGRLYYKEEFGVDSEILWLPDSFGYSAALPQILKGCNMKYLVTQKIFWSYNDGERFPYHYFNWEGMDGTRIVSFLPTSYTYQTDPKQMNEIWKNRAQAQDLEAFLVPYGYGDGGGGPSRDFVEYVKREENLEGCPKVKFAGPKEFFSDIQEMQGAPENTYVGELYFAAHRGTYTSQAKVKQNNRRAELALREMEMWSSIAGENGFAYDFEQADALWKELLLHQFHDILPGSSIGKVYREAEKAVEGVIAAACRMNEKAMSALTEPDGDGAVTLFNSLSFPRTALVKLPARFAGGAATSEGEAVPIQISAVPDAEHSKNENYVVEALVTLPPCGVLTLVPQGMPVVLSEENMSAAANAPEAASCAEHPAASMSEMTGCAEDLAANAPEAVSCEKYPMAFCREAEDGFVVENKYLTARINRKGEVVSFILKSSGREFAAEPLNRLHLYKDVPRLFDAWDIDSNYTEQEIEAAHDVCVRIEKQGLEAVLEVTGQISESAYTQRIRLEAESARLEFETDIDWKELHRLLKAAFPVEVYAENGINEIQFGYVNRPTHRSRQYDRDRFEVCNHRYSALADSVHGAAVLNDCKYGISMNGNSMELTLLRASAGPEMRADNRKHHFTYSFTAWEGSFMKSDVVRQGYELNVRPGLAEGSLAKRSYLSTEKDNIILDTMKPTQDGSGDIILRFYESKKAATTTRIFTGLGKKAYVCDMMENILEEIPFENGEMELSFRAFEIKTVRVKS